MTPRYELSLAAAEDIAEIFTESLQAFGLNQTESYVSTLERCLTLLAANPRMGGKAEDVRRGYRRFPHTSHVIYYTLSPDGIFVVRVLHKRMDAELNLTREA